MSELGDRMELIRSTFAATVPARIVTRDFLDFADRKAADLTAGIYTLMSSGENGYENLNGRAAMDGGQRITLIGQIKLPEKTNGAPTAPHLVEDAEFAMVDEVKAFLRSLPPALCRLVMHGFRQSQQLDAPYGWVAIDLEFIK